MYCLDMLEIALTLGRQDRRTRTWRRSSSNTSPHRQGLSRHRPVGRATTASTTMSSALEGRPAATVAGALDRRVAPAVRGHHARHRDAHSLAVVHASISVVHRQPSRVRRAHDQVRERDGKTVACSPSSDRSDSARSSPTCSTRTSSSRRTDCGRSSRRHPTTRSPSISPASTTGRLRAGGVDDAAVRRQLELARAGLVPRELPRRSKRSAVPPLLRRRVHRRDADAAPGNAMHTRRGRRGARRGGCRRSSSTTSDGRRPAFGGVRAVPDRPAWHDQLLFHEYFHGDDGAGLGASHQTGWTGLVADLIVRRED